MRQFSNGGPLRHAVAALATVLALVGAAGAQAAKPASLSAFVPASLLDAARANPEQTFAVIVQGTRGSPSSAVAGEVSAAGDEVKRRFSSISAVSTTLTGKKLLALAAKRRIAAITPDAPVHISGSSSKQRWPAITGVKGTWDRGVQLPAIAIVDSGIDASRADFGGRVVDQVSLTARTPNSPGDGRGHGTFVAAVAAGNAEDWAGAAPAAPLVSIDVVDDTGAAQTSDVIAAADWILANRSRLNIRVANFSLQSSAPGSFLYDPLNKAVERLWFSGVVVVAAVGNYGISAATDVGYAPGNDPFVISVGASDIRGTNDTKDDVAAPWSAFGYTFDGFAKPELSAPGRYMVSAMPPTATLALERPERMVGSDHMQLSGTSFAAPVVAGAAAYVLGVHPTWSPGQVKGALMATVKATPAALPASLGAGSVDARRASEVFLPPNPNLALDAFVAVDLLAGGVSVFDTASWTSAAQLSTSWDTASWTSASWTSASWTSASWTSASWTSASWTSASWTSASWTSASWTSASWTSSTEDDYLAAGGYFETLDDLLAP